MKGLKFARGLGQGRDNSGAPRPHEPHDMKGGEPENKKEHASAFRRRRTAWLAAAAGLVLFAGITAGARKQYVSAHTVTYYKVLLHGEVVGTVSQERELDELFEKKTREYQDKYPGEVMVLQTEGITTEADSAYKPEVDSEATLSKLDGMLKAYAVGVQLMVEGKPAGIVKDQAAAAAVLAGVKKHYIPAAQTAAAGTAAMKKTAASSSAPASKDKVESVQIREGVSVVPVKADPNKVLDVEEAIRKLTEGEQAPLLYTVQEGDTISSIARRYSITQEEIFRNNPGVKELTLQIGDELQLTVPQPALTVVSVEQVSEQVVTEPEVIVRGSAELPAGKTKVVRPGQTGLKEMQYRVTKENGLVVKEEWLGQSVLKPSLPEVVYTGTKVVGKGSGSFAWPVRGAVLSSSYGERWGRAHKGIDLVSGNRTILASDGGRVVFAGVQSGYGNVVIIDHKNGYQTYYGHLSRISVSVGQQLEQGGKVGIMGNTGRSTGTHLHFEIRKNGSALNPMKFLR